MSALSDFETWLAAGTGRPPSEEGVAAARGLDRGARRRARRAVRRGKAAGSPAEARYAVALARASEQRSAPVWAVLGLLVLALLALGVAIADVAGGKVRIADALLLLLAVLLGWVLSAITRRQRAAARAESANRELLERSGEPYVPLGSDAPADTPPLAGVVGYPFLFVSYGAVFGAAMTAVHGQAVTVAHVWQQGWFYATAMTVANAVLRHRRGREGGASATSR